MNKIDHLIAEENVTELRRFLAHPFKHPGGSVGELNSQIEQLLLATWHQEHEDIVNLVYLQNLKDDRFIQPILNIAKKRDVFRPFDDELESTLRKCVHALKTIDTNESRNAIELLARTGNMNVKYALENYK